MQERRTVLIVAHRAEDRISLRRILSGAYQVVEAADGNEALQMAERCFSQLAAILFDTDIPGIDGYEVARVMQSRGWMRTIPVFLLTGADLNTALVRGYELGCIDVLSKPFCAEAIRGKVDNIVDALPPPLRTGERGAGADGPHPEPGGAASPD